MREDGKGLGDGLQKPVGNKGMGVSNPGGEVRNGRYSSEEVRKGFQFPSKKNLQKIYWDVYGANREDANQEDSKGQEGGEEEEDYERQREKEEASKHKLIRGRLIKAKTVIFLLRTWMFMRSSLWMWPLLSIATNFVIGSALSSIDIYPDEEHGYTIFFRGSASDAGSILTFVGSFVMALTGTVFSLAIVAFQVAAVNYSPRVLNDLMRNSATKVVLATFLGTVAYSYACLLTVKDTERSHYSPVFAVNFMLLHLFCVIVALVYYLDFVVRSLSVAKLLDDITWNTIHAASHLTSNVEKHCTDEGTEDIDLEVELPMVPRNNSYSIYAVESGYLVQISEQATAYVAESHDVVIRFRPKIGEFITANTPIAWVWKHGAAGRNSLRLYAIDDHEREMLTRQLNKCLFLGPRRSVTQDIGFGFKQLTDIALKGLSPGVNDPTTACEALDRMEKVFALLSTSYLNHSLLSKADISSSPALRASRVNVTVDRGVDPEELLVVIPRASFEDLLDLGVHPIRWYGKKDVTVCRRLLYMLGSAGSLIAPFGSRMKTRMAAIERHIETVVNSALESFGRASPEFDAVLYAAQHAYFLIHGGKTARVRDFDSSESSSDSDEEQNNRAEKVAESNRTTTNNMSYFASDDPEDADPQDPKEETGSKPPSGDPTDEKEEDRRPSRTAHEEKANLRADSTAQQIVDGDRSAEEDGQDPCVFEDVKASEQEEHREKESQDSEAKSQENDGDRKKDNRVWEDKRRESSRNSDDDCAEDPEGDVSSDSAPVVFEDIKAREAKKNDKSEHSKAKKKAKAEQEDSDESSGLKREASTASGSKNSSNHEVQEEKEQTTAEEDETSDSEEKTHKSEEETKNGTENDNNNDYSHSENEDGKRMTKHDILKQTRDHED